MLRFPIGSLLLAIAWVTTGCMRFDFDLTDDDPSVPDRETFHPGSTTSIHPGLSATWTLLPSEDEPRRGLFDGLLPTAVPSPDEEASADADPTDAGGDGPASNAPPERRRRVSDTVASIDFDYRAALGGQDHEKMRGTDFAEWDGIRIDPPQRLRCGFDQHVATLGLGAGPRIGRFVKIEALGGLTVGVLHLVVRGTGQRAGDTAVGIGGHLGLRGTLTPHPVGDLYAEFRLHALGVPQNDRRTAFVTTAEVGGRLHLTPIVSVFTGWRRSTWNENPHRSSDVRVDISGPTFGLLLRH